MAALVYTCFSSDFFLEDADQYRLQAWQAIRERQDLHFFIPTKRIHRFPECIPPDWGNGYENVTIACTAENQAMADKRLPIFVSLPIRHREIIVEPMLERMDIGAYLTGIEHVTVGGESGQNARQCDLQWVRDLRRQCLTANVPLWFKQTGARFINAFGETVHVARMNQSKLAAQYGLSTE
jgi:protein gp37